MLLNAFSRDKRWQNCEEKNGGLKVPLFDFSAAMVVLTLEPKGAFDWEIRI